MKLLDCRGGFLRYIGLMFRRNDAAIFDFDKEKNLKIHTYFMRYDIGCYFYDENWKVVDKKVALKPWQVYQTFEKARYLLEVPSQSLN